MTAKEAIDRLVDPVRNLILAASGSVDFGASEKDATDVTLWMEKVAKNNVLGEENIKSLDSHLLSRTFLVSNYLTAADVAVYGALHPVISKEQPAQHYSHPSVTRYFDHVQTRPQVRSAAHSLSPPLALVEFDLENAPKPARTSEPPKKKTTKAVPEAARSQKTGDITPAAAGGSAARVGKKDKTEPKEKKKETSSADAGGKKAKSGGAPSANEPIVPVPSMIDLRVGLIVDVHKHPDADGLYVEKIDIGEETGPRTVVSGLVNYIPIEQMRDKWLVAVCNLKPASMRGVKSYAMVLCATSKDGKEGGIEVIDPPKNSKPGDRVYFEGPFENDTPLDQLNPKRKIFETIQPGFITLDSREAAWADPVSKAVHRIRTKDGVCLAPSLVGASLS